MGLWSDMYEAWTRNTSLENIRAERRIRQARQDERGRPKSRSLLDYAGRVPYGRFDKVIDDEK